jgi:hypothetical protein
MSEIESQSQSTEQEWKFYDFDANWDKFLKIWKSEPIQDRLEYDMTNWCKNHTKDMKYKRGDQLWTFSETDYWSKNYNDEVINEAMDEVCEYEMVNTYYKRMKEILGDSYDRCKDKDDDIFQICMSAVMKKFTPKNDSLESLIMISGKNYIIESLYEVAKIIFRNKIIVLVDDADENNNFILIPSEKIVFDLFDYYFEREDETDIRLKSDDYYDCMCDYDENDEIDETD